MGQITSDVLIARLAEWGVDTVFGIPGDGINGIMEGLRRHSDKVKFVLVHHEEAAAFMATGYAKQTGRLGVCLATSGPGAIHLLNGLYDAKLDHVPVLAITGMQETSLLGTGYQQEVHLEHLFEDVAEYNQMIVNPAQLPTLLDLAIKTAFARRGVAHLTIPNDIQVADAGSEPWPSVAPAASPHTSARYLQPTIRPEDEDVRTAAHILNASKKAAILVGIGARGSADLIEQLADHLGAPVVKSLSGKMVLPDDSVYTTGGIGLLGTAPSEDLMDDIDTLVMLGTNFPYTKHLPKPGAVKVVQVDIDPVRAGGRLPTDAPLIGDVSTTLKSLLALIERHDDRSHLEKYQRAMNEWRTSMASLENPDRDPIAPQYVVKVLDELAANDAVMTCDSGTIATWAARHWTIQGEREFYLSGNLASMAPGLPYAIGIADANPGREVHRVCRRRRLRHADGGVQHCGPLRAADQGRHQQQQCARPDPVGADGARLSRARRPLHRAAAGLRRVGPRLWGRSAPHVSKPHDVRDAITAALEYDGPALVDVRCQRGRAADAGQGELRTGPQVC